MTSTPDLDRLRRERDLYKRLLDMGKKNEIQPLIEDSLRLIVDITRAEQGYLELLDADGTKPVHWAVAPECSSDDLATIRGRISSGILAEALATGETIQTPSALLDPRFATRPSVRGNRIEAVLCTPLGFAESLGALYLQGSPGGRPFSEEDIVLIREFAQHVTPFVAQIRRLEQSQAESDHTRQWRAHLPAIELVGRSAALAEVLRNAALVAPHRVSVLLTGASGTGKTALARVIHDSSPRRTHPFVEVNCAALPEGLVESELFGAMPGAHSTALRKIDGKVAAADRGTLFLDEIGELPLTVQSKLLQLLQSGTYYPLGSPRPIKANIRVIAATNSDLNARVSDKTFREDLLYRLEVIPIRLPDLDERRTDIEPLANHFCKRFRDIDGLPLCQISPEGSLVLNTKDWPGNVRQLENTIRAGIIRAVGDGTTIIERHHLFPNERSDPDIADEGKLGFYEATHAFQRRLLEQTLTRTNWNVSEAARQLGLKRSTIHNLIRTRNLKRKK